MFKSILVSLAIIGVTFAASHSEWMVFKAKHGKSYSERVDSLRRMIYEDNMQRIKIHNEKYARGEATFYLGENKFTDMTTAEFSKRMNGLIMSTIPTPEVDVVEVSNVSLPEEINWVQKGYVTSVKNQGTYCGSCWAFSTTGSLEGAHFKKTGKLVSLSEENLMDCSRKYPNRGCNGGLMNVAFQYVIQNKGIDTEESYPYVAKQGTCQFNRKNVGATEISYKGVASGSESALQEAVATIGPVSVAIDASSHSFNAYSGGVYDEPACSSTSLDHGVLVVGYGVEDGQDYWLVKNSWGPDWGEEGYIKMSRNKNNQCGIATMASYPIV